MSAFNRFFDKPDVGQLILRVGLGIVLAIHGLGKFLGGADRLEGVGKAMGTYGIDAVPIVWGTLAATVELVGGLFIVLGLFFRPSAFFMTFVMLTALLTRFPESPSIDNFGSFAYPLAMFFAFLGLLFVGPGRYSMKKGSAA